jgi:hypothetical protein
MANLEEIFFEPTFKLLICKRHGSGVHPTKEAVKRHLRGEGHRCGGERLQQAVLALSKLPLPSLKAVLDATPAVDKQPVVPPIRHLRVWPGWSCTPCEGRFLSTSLELMQRHAASQHGRRRGQQPLWEACKLQTCFSETKDRRYFRVASVLGVRTKDSVSTTISTTDFSALQDSRFELLRRSSSPVQSITLQHPFMQYAAKYVPLPVHRLDNLLKSEAFLSAAHPVFDSSHIDSALNMGAVFPQSQEEPVFVNALLYATVQLLNRGNPTIEGLSLQARTLRLLQEKLTSLSQTFSPPVVGAIMILKATAYKTGDRPGHIAHTAGLANALEISAGNSAILTPAARRATFWLNLSAALVMDCKRAENVEFPKKVVWQRENLADRAKDPPIGFARHRASLPDGLLGCIVDTVELQSFIRLEAMALSSRHTTHDQFDPMQTSIESRLASMAHACMDIGVVAEAVRLGVFMCYYCIWMETWNDSLIPCMLAAKLLDVLEPTALFGPQHPSNIWLQHMDLLLWLLLVGSSVVELDRGQVEGLRLRQSSLIDSILSAHRFPGDFCAMDLKRDLQVALHDFIYKDGWLQKRCFIKDWFKLEYFINTSDN